MLLIFFFINCITSFISLRLTTLSSLDRSATYRACGRLGFILCFFTFLSPSHAFCLSVALFVILLISFQH
ncbi:hypothetical protein BDZ91DRAFT_748273 [Kalaharituber pfeilii]|nr:hypothetical protein BDZ91DRAFT_748273 [Kalaharituber pfeilii]